MNKNNENQSLAYSLIVLLKKVIFGFIILVFLIVGGFIYYINTLDNGSYSSVDATGVYNLVDSEGNVIATDLTQEDIAKIVELLNNGENKGN